MAQNGAVHRNLITVELPHFGLAVFTTPSARYNFASIIVSPIVLAISVGFMHSTNRGIAC
jgi:hypothetical protein